MFHVPVYGPRRRRGPTIRRSSILSWLKMENRVQFSYASRNMDTSTIEWWQDGFRNILMDASITAIVCGHSWFSRCGNARRACFTEFIKTTSLFDEKFENWYFVRGIFYINRSSPHGSLIDSSFRCVVRPQHFVHDHQLQFVCLWNRRCLLCCKASTLEHKFPGNHKPMVTVVSDFYLGDSACVEHPSL